MADIRFDGGTSGGGGGGVTSVGLITGNTGTDINVTGSPVTSTGVFTLNIPVASSGATGKLNNTDWANFNNKQAPLVSGANIKTINGNSILGAGDLVVSGVPAGTDGQVQYNNGGAFGGATALFYDDSNNFVGVGTIAPSVKLDVDGAAAVYGASVRGSGVFSGMNIRNTGVQAANRGAQLTFSSGTTLVGALDSAYNTGLVNESAGAGSYFIEYWNGSSYAIRLLINSNGFVGLGVANPQVKLDVDGASAISTAQFKGAGNDVGINVWNSGTLGANRTSQIRLTNGSTFFGANDESYQIINSGDSFNDASFVIQHWNGSAYFERFRILNNGNVGIGTSAPLGILHLKTTAQTTRFLIDGDAGQSKIITFRTNGLQRWGLYSNNVAESGSNAGSNFAFRRYNDAGTLLGTPLSIVRSTGQTTISEGLTLAGSELRSFKASISTLSSLVVDSSNAAAYTGTIFVCSGSSVTIDASVPDGFNLSVIQQTATQTGISVTGALTIRNRQGHTSAAGQYATITLLKQGSDLYLGGDTA